MPTSLEIAVRAHWANAWLLYSLGTPVVVIDGAKHHAAWRRDVRISVAPGRHSVAVGFRYRGTPWLLGVRERDYVVRENATLSLAAKNSALTSEPFHVEIRSHQP